MPISEQKILDKGYLALEAVMGDDYTPVEAARVSTDNGRKGEPADSKLLRFLIKNRHTSPFEMVEIRWEVVAPIFVARQWVRHRTANWNERSLRYTEEENPEFYFPNAWRLQDTKNKQGSSGILMGDDSLEMDRLLTEFTQLGMNAYNRAKELGVANEMARFFLPITYYTKFWWKNDLKNTMDFLREREADDSQLEIRKYANSMREQLEVDFPKCMNLYKEFYG